jgi:quercetin dioxygenase-like cupin family protein
MTSTPSFKVLNWRDAPMRENHGVEIRDLFRASVDGGFKSSFDYVSFFTLAPGSVSTAHTHPDREKICYVVAGSVEVRLADQVAQVHSGDTFFVPSGVEHEVTNNTAETAQYVFFINQTLAESS